MSVDSRNYREITNEFGFIQMVDAEDYPICSQCGACVMPNRGQGTMCDKCIHEDLIESEKMYEDYYG